VAAGTFRSDLYYRLAAFPIRLPPLRARQHDIPLLAGRFLSDACARHQKEIHGLDPAAVALLERYDWPGNIRELQNEIERAVVLTPHGGIIQPGQLSSELRASLSDSGKEPDLTAPAAEPPAAAESPSGDSKSLRDARATFEARFIADVLAHNDGNVSRSAGALGISRISLQRKMKEYGLR
jgi:transcriptional regulator with PAS, ATPase and Fis domain